MNKQELIEYCESLKGDLNKFINGIDVNKIVKKIEQLDEPQKPVLPQFVADWIDNVKRNGLKQKNSFCFFEEITSDSSAYTVMYHIFKEGIATKNIRNWVSDNTDEFARAWLDGYEVEKEKRYIVKVKGVEKGYDYLNYRISLDSWFFSGESEPLDFRTKHTRKELEEAGFGEVFNSPLFEVEEVE